MQTTKIIKKGKSANHNNKEYIVVKLMGKTKAQEMINKYGKEYHPGMTSADKQPDGSYVKILWKRDVPLKTTKDITGYYYWV